MNTAEQFAIISSTKSVRKAITMQSHFWFFHVYLNQYITYETAPFHREMLQLTENPQLSLLVFMAFRGSGKSTILSLSYPLWALLGKKKKRCILILSQTQYQAQSLLQHIKHELEENILLRKDFGPFVTRTTQWSADTIVIPRYDAKIIAASTEQSIRGIRHAEVRPDLIICDDIEDLSSVKTMESRNKTFQWLSGEIIPAGDRHTQTVILGNLLHEDSLLMRINKLIDDDRIDGIVKRYPIISEGKPLWAAKFPNEASLVQEQRKIGNPIAWKREFELQIVPEDGQVISYDDIHYYDTLPEPKEPEQRELDDYTNVIRLEKVCTGIDLAISKKDSADYTAMVSIEIFSFEHEEIKFYVLPHPINKRLSFAETIEQADNISKRLGKTHPTQLYVEQVAYQASAVETLKERRLPVEGITVTGADKRARLQIVSPLIEQGQILFPRTGAEDLIAQIVGFGVERHDDLLDAFTLVIMQVMNMRPAWQLSDMNNEPIKRMRMYSKCVPGGYFDPPNWNII
ncbi:MAG: hypothetical protein WCV88_00805 [Patescibacteria group bacterium]